MRVDASAKDVRCVVARARGFRWSQRLARKKSTTGVIVRRSKQTLAETRVVFANACCVIKLSSGDAKCYGLVRGACTSFSNQSLYRDGMIDVPIDIYSDSSTARSVGRKRGIGGRIRRLPTRHLSAVGHMKFDVVVGEQNPADILTKALSGRKIREWSEHVGQNWSRHSGSNSREVSYGHEWSQP